MIEKNYFYPDSPKIIKLHSFLSLMLKMEFKITTNSGKEASVGIERIQIEEDTAKSIHGF